MVTWNREHIKKLKTIRIVTKVNEEREFKTPLIVDPEAVI